MGAGGHISPAPGLFGRNWATAWPKDDDLTREHGLPGALCGRDDFLPRFFVELHAVHRYNIYIIKSTSHWRQTAWK